jgi:hypothetical protein
MVQEVIVVVLAANATPPPSAAFALEPESPFLVSATRREHSISCTLLMQTPTERRGGDNNSAHYNSTDATDLLAVTQAAI